jgi:LmbE family N-acetylglucosaminyl deacetylase
MGAHFRVNLGLADGSVMDDLPSRERLVRILRESKPRWVLSNLEEDHHPDHATGARLVKSSYFLSRLPRFIPEVPAHSPEVLLFYLIHTLVQPTFLVDISSTLEAKMEVLTTYRTQFVDPKLPENYRYTGLSDYLQNVRSLGEVWGIQAGSRAAEAFLSSRPLLLENLGRLTPKPK